jgi:group II intron reverse transcriptase/maturase
MIDAELLLWCWGDLNQDAASGVDQVSAAEYAKELHANVAALVEKLKKKRYRAKLVRRSYIPKEKGKKRPLGILVIEDKLLQLACAKLLGAIYEQDFLDCSYAYRPKRGPGDAVKDLTFKLQYGSYGYLVELDIKSYFDRIVHDLLVEMLGLRIDDRAFLNLIRKWLKAGILDTDGQIIHPETGTPQGGIVSPILANLYLHHALDLWFEKMVKPQIQGEAQWWRFADDGVCAFRFKEDAERVYRELPKRLRRFGLEVAPEKTQILSFSRFDPGKERRFAFLGFEFYWEPDRKGVPRVKRRTARKKLRVACQRIKEWIRTNRHQPGRDFFRGLNARLRGHYNYYGVRGNFESVSRFYQWAIGNAFKWLNRRGGKRRSFTCLGSRKSAIEKRSPEGIRPEARKRVRPKNRMRENCTFGSVRGGRVTGVPTVDSV